MEKFTLKNYLTDLEYLVNFDSGSYIPEGTRKVAEFFKEKFDGAGWITQIQETKSDKVGPCLKVVNRKSDSYDILILGHMDTVFLRGEAAKRPFYVDADGMARGAGVADMKGGLLVAYYALAELENAQKLNNINVCFFFASDEEIGTIHSQEFIKETAALAKHVIVVEPARKNGNLVNERSGVANYYLHAFGIAAHAGVAPQDGSSAINELAHWIIELHKLNDYSAGTSVNVGIIKGGAASNVVAASADAEVDIRFKSDEELNRIKKTVDELSKKRFTSGGAHVEAVFKENRPPMNPSAKTLEMCEIISHIGKELKINFNWMSTGGGSDGNTTAAMGIPTVDGMGPVGGDTHSEKEWLDTKTVEPRMRLMQKTILHVAALK